MTEIPEHLRRRAQEYAETKKKPPYDGLAWKTQAEAQRVADALSAQYNASARVINRPRPEFVVFVEVNQRILDTLEVNSMAEKDPEHIIRDVIAEALLGPPITPEDLAKKVVAALATGGFAIGEDATKDRTTKPKDPQEDSWAEVLDSLAGTLGPIRDFLRTFGDPRK